MKYLPKNCENKTNNTNYKIIFKTSGNLKNERKLTNKINKKYLQKINKVVESIQNKTKYYQKLYAQIKLQKY